MIKFLREFFRSKTEHRLILNEDTNQYHIAYRFRIGGFWSKWSKTTDYSDYTFMKGLFDEWVEIEKNRYKPKPIPKLRIIEEST